jgi:hypothetical protein
VKSCLLNSSHITTSEEDKKKKEIEENASPGYAAVSQKHQ